MSAQAQPIKLPAPAACFALTPLGDTLRSDVPGSLRLLAIELLGRNHHAAWEQLLFSVKTGATAFDHVFGVSRWQYNAEHPMEATAFDDAMASFNSIVASAVVASYDFSSCGTSAILKAQPSLRGALADLPHVLDAGDTRFGAEGAAERCEVVAADFFKSVPKDDT